MANYCYSDYRITGDAAELDKLYLLMLKIEREKEHGNWVGHIVEALNKSIPQHLYVRGWWSELVREEDCIHFQLESAWEPLNEAWDFICSKFNDLTMYFSGEEPGCEVFLKRENTANGWYTDNYYLDASLPEAEAVQEYFQTLDDALSFIEKISGQKVSSPEDVEALNEKLLELDEDAYIHLNEFAEV